MSSKSSDNDKFEAAKVALLKKKVQIAIEVNEKGHLFKAVHEQDIVEAATAAGKNLTSKWLKQ